LIAMCFWIFVLYVLHLLDLSLLILPCPSFFGITNVPAVHSDLPHFSKTPMSNNFCNSSLNT
jgi:hypothetical protein